MEEERWHHHIHWGGIIHTAVGIAGDIIGGEVGEGLTIGANGYGIYSDIHNHHH